MHKNISTLTQTDYWGGIVAFRAHMSHNNCRARDLCILHDKCVSSCVGMVLYFIDLLTHLNWKLQLGPEMIVGLMIWSL